MRTQEFLDASIQLDRGHRDFYKNSSNMSRMGFFSPSALVLSGQRVARLIKTNFDGKMLFKMGHFSFISPLCHKLLKF